MVNPVGKRVRYEYTPFEIVFSGHNLAHVIYNAAQCSFSTLVCAFSCTKKMRGVFFSDPQWKVQFVRLKLFHRSLNEIGFTTDFFRLQRLAKVTAIFMAGNPALFQDILSASLSVANDTYFLKSLCTTLLKIDTSVAYYQAVKISESIQEIGQILLTDILCARIQYEDLSLEGALSIYLSKYRCGSSYQSHLDYPRIIGTYITKNGVEEIPDFCSFFESENIEIRKNELYPHLCKILVRSFGVDILPLALQLVQQIPDSGSKNLIIDWILRGILDFYQDKQLDVLPVIESVIPYIQEKEFYEDGIYAMIFLLLVNHSEGIDYEIIKSYHDQIYDLSLRQMLLVDAAENLLRSFGTDTGTLLGKICAEIEKADDLKRVKYKRDIRMVRLKLQRLRLCKWSDFEKQVVAMDNNEALEIIAYHRAEFWDGSNALSEGVRIASRISSLHMRANVLRRLATLSMKKMVGVAAIRTALGIIQQIPGNVARAKAYTEIANAYSFRHFFGSNRETFLVDTFGETFLQPT